MRFYKLVLAFLTLLTVTVWLAVLALPDDALHLIVCDVGQGDAVLITRGKTQILVDAGPNSAVLDCLGQHLPFWDNRIEMVFLTHPETDHFTGLIEIFKRYRVDYYFVRNDNLGSPEYQALKELVGSSRAKVIDPGTNLKLSSNLIYLDVVFPVGQGLVTEKSGQRQSSNNLSVILQLQYKNFLGLLTGDIDNDISDQLAEIINKNVTFLKVPHHGSKNGLSENLVKKITPQIAVISVGKNNSYGHPHPETLAVLDKFRVKIFRTDTDGTIEIVSDGNIWWRKK